MSRFIFHVGQYFIFLSKVFVKPERWNIYIRQTIREIDKIGVRSIGIVTLISVFIGAVLTIQAVYNVKSPILPNYLIAYAVRDSLLLEFSSTIIGLILAGKVGSNIASEIGSMRITEQIDALEMMGVNSASFVTLPKIIAALLFNPILMVLSTMVGIIGGWVAGFTTGIIASDEFIYGIQYNFHPYYVTYATIKTLVFAFLITSISSYFGYYARGGSVEVGNASTQATVYGSVFVLFFNLVLTQLLLA
ncbi:MAG: ABC transporter permease [Bacteroidales bacterium]|nr:ABC transporter permease [Bacteroidales bacterium]HOK98741.1 ABC transporter permease [Bacteroidales bacterium]HPO66203.1 ABC transporter permease [Bacteroidales bacterium]